MARLMKTADRGLLYGMPLAGTACATREFSHAQIHPSGLRPHAEQTRRELAKDLPVLCLAELAEIANHYFTVYLYSVYTCKKNNARG